MITMASSWGRWTLSTSLSVNVIACSSVVLVLGDRLESWMFCTTFRYVFLDLDDWLVELPPMIILISPSGGYDDSSGFPFNFSSLWSHLRKFLNFPYLMRFSICCFRSKHSSVSCPWSLWKWQYLFLLRLFKSPFIFSDHFKEGSSLICIRTCLSGMFNGMYCWFQAKGPAFLPSRSFVSSVPFLDEGLRVACGVCFHSLCSLPLLGYNRVFYIHKVLGQIDEFNHRLRLFLIKLVDE